MLSSRWFSAIAQSMPAISSWPSVDLLADAGHGVGRDDDEAVRREVRQQRVQRCAVPPPLIHTTIGFLAPFGASSVGRYSV